VPLPGTGDAGHLALTDCGLAVLAAIASSTTARQLTTGHTRLAALTSGYHAAYLAAASAALAALLAATLLRPARTAPPDPAPPQASPR
jgi:hypothetical protein